MSVERVGYCNGLVLLSLLCTDSALCVGEVAVTEENKLYVFATEGKVHVFSGFNEFPNTFELNGIKYTYSGGGNNGNSFDTEDLSESLLFWWGPALPRCLLVMVHGDVFDSNDSTLELEDIAGAAEVLVSYYVAEDATLQ